MPQENRYSKLEVMDVLIGVTILVCLIFCHFANQAGFHVEAMAVTTGAIMCVQDNARTAWTTSATRISGVVVGGMYGVGIALIDSAVGSPTLFYILCTLGVVATLLVCKFFKMIYVQARVSALTMLLVAMVSDGVGRVDYARNRFIGSLVGAVLALAVSLDFSLLPKKKK